MLSRGDELSNLRRSLDELCPSRVKSETVVLMSPDFYLATLEQLNDFGKDEVFMDLEREAPKENLEKVFTIQVAITGNKNLFSGNSAFLVLQKLETINGEEEE